MVSDFAGAYGNVPMLSLVTLLQYEIAVLYLTHPDAQLDCSLIEPIGHFVRLVFVQVKFSGTGVSAAVNARASFFIFRNSAALIVCSKSILNPNFARAIVYKSISLNP